MPFTEFYCRSGGSNLNGGSLSTGAEPATSAVYTCTNSNWNGTSTFTPTDGSTPASTVTVGDFASVYLDGATVGVYVARVTAVAAGANGAITLSTTAKSGTAPTSGATGRTIKVGGAWKGPNAAESFPFNFITATSTNASGSLPRVNLKNDADYSVTSGVTHANTTVRFQGYTTTAGDGGRFTLDGGATGASYNLFTLSATNCDVVDGIFKNNGDSGAGNIVNCSGSENMFRRCVFANARNSGVNVNTGSSCNFIECEAYNNNLSNTATTGGFLSQVVANFIRCIAHDNVGTNTSGFINTSVASGVYISCISDSNEVRGFDISSTVYSILLNCEAYNNGSDGIRFANTTATHFYVENCNLIKNGTGGTGYGINGSGAGVRNGSVINCGFGSGTQANATGATNGLSMMVESGSVTYSSNSNPWVDPANGNFKINSSESINAGRGGFTQTASSYTGTIGFPDIGAAQHQESAGGGTTGMLPSPTMNGGLV